ncbi:ATP-binding protein [Candidatus Gracilibacteria bacterium]|nr:ATP-binding protein [Candidatus Gracilibacteria bacterium]
MYHLHLDTLDSHTDYEALVNQYREGNMLQVCFDYVSDFRQAKILRDIFEAICKQYHFGDILTARMTLVIDELNNNAIEYGSRTGDTNTMSVVVEKRDKNIEVCIEVSDSGKGSQHKNASEMNELKQTILKEGFTHHHSIRGRGLFMIIQNIVDDLYFKDTDAGGLIVGVKRSIEL